ncbi:MAG TPA: T9SS type A sorting domain-containing protein [Ignavibacteriales bacterium]|nr:T9SS type A sorting domain-containing protein [Ignavibacteriales bacterium]
MLYFGDKIILGTYGNAKYIYIDNSIEVKDNGAQPDNFSLAQNYPNPFNPETKISFSLPQSGKASLKVYDMLGREVAELVNGQMEKGTHSINFNGRSLSSGVYIYRLQAGAFTESKKMILMK